MNGPVEIVAGYLPGCLGWIIQAHGEYYARRWNLGPAFELDVARGLAELMTRFDEDNDGLWLARRDGRVVGAIVLDAHPPGQPGARLRFFIMDESLQGQGVGGRLADALLDHARRRGIAPVFLWTFEGLAAARRIYETRGFRLVEEYVDTDWGRPVNHQKFLLEA